MPETPPSPGPVEIERGEFYEDCAFHPLVCVSVDYDRDELVGISLIDGGIRCCSPTHCGVIKLSPEDAVERRWNWNAFVEANGLTEYTASRYPLPPNEPT